MKWCVLFLVVCIGMEGKVMAKRSLGAYKKKRDFKASPEPVGDTIKSKTGKPIFVIQKHKATSLHYDLRLEIDGVLVSWAIPKGPSLNPEEKRLAIMTEDHPMDYATFEGVIPKGQYGAGPVMVWDKGTYKNIKEKDGTLVAMEQCLKNGQIEVFLDGTKIKGAYALVRTKLGNGDKQWLLIKMKDEFASKRKNPVNTKNKSVLSGRTMYQIEKEG